ncbi:alpha/beta hydrolase [Isoptericola sp. NEAU-Y5]|uniref:Alpha/beta hydrolase n=1 Tax=Isoptericola luteus TaxID=2879484 RepID=A0ABS7ZAV0_9MICO|nr:alpha/beta hydrolase [Isoptericola sp. NEAU-Y5]MCA5892186.1 alpha/beta hydrolase [Isoptericola sp. NEAU-Y5]
MILDARRSPARCTPDRRSTALRTPVVVLVAGALLVLAGCTTPAKEQAPVVGSTTGPAAEQAPEGFEAYYGQTLEWTECEDGLQCATASAPLSWQDAEAGTIELNLVRNTANAQDPSARIGSLLVNPGGPGASGAEFVRSDAASDGALFGERLQDAFDIVGFDPRGVQDSTAVECLDDKGKDEFLTQSFGTTDDELAAKADAYREWGEACAKNTGDLLGHVDTQSAARDIDMLRAVLGDDTLNYLGYSYGTQLGATYAGLFPERAGRLVLDGAIDTTLSADDISKGQAVGFENALRAFVEDCQAGTECPLVGTVDDGMRQVRAVLDEAYERPYPTTGSDREVTQNLAFYGVARTLYSQGDWSFLAQALTEVIDDGTGDLLLTAADSYNDRNLDGTFSTNSSEAFSSIGCLDDRGTSNLDQMREEAAAIEEAAPTMGTFFAYGGLTCAEWPYPEVEQEFDLQAKGAPPIVVIGTTNDPATPYVWAEGLADTLDSGVLVTYEGEGHTAYSPSRSCVADVVESYLVDGKVPDDGVTC